MSDLIFKPAVPPAFLFVALLAVLVLLFTSRARWAARACFCMLALAVLILAAGPAKPGAVSRLPGGVVLLDTSASMSRDHRFDKARELAGFFARQALMPWHLVRFARTTEEIPFAELGRLEPNGEETRLGGALRWVARSYEDLLAVVLFSDGRDLGRADPLKWARALGARKVRIYAVPCGLQEGPPDASIVVPPARLLVLKPGEKVDFQVKVNVVGANPEHITLEVSRLRKGPSGMEKELLLRRLLPVKHGKAETTLHLVATKEPYTVWEFEIKRLEGEKDTQDNRAYIVSRLPEAQAPWLLITGKPRWEDTFLLYESALAGEPVLQALQAVASDRAVFTGLTRRPLPLGPDLIREADCLLLGEKWFDLLRPEARREALLKPVFLLAGALLPDGTDPWGPWVWGRFELSRDYRSTLLAGLSGRLLQGKTLRSQQVRAVAWLRDSSGKKWAVVGVLPEKKTALFGIVNGPWVEFSHQRLLVRTVFELLGLRSRRKAGPEYLSYSVLKAIRLTGEPGSEVRISGPGTEVSLVLDRKGSGMFVPEKPGLYRFDFPEGISAFASVSERRPEYLIDPPDHALLSSVARASGGGVVPAERRPLQELRNRLEAEAKRCTPTSAVWQWDSPLVFLVFYLLVACVWIAVERMP